MKEHTTYDISTKIHLVEDYFKRKEIDATYSQSKYAKENGIPYQTFNGWIKTYENNKGSFVQVSEESDTVEVMSKEPCFIELSEEPTNVIETIPRVATPIVNENIKLDFKGVSLEFSYTHLKDVLEIIKKW